MFYMNRFLQVILLRLTPQFNIIRIFKFCYTISKFNFSTEIILFIRIINQQFLQTFIAVLEMGKYNIKFNNHKETFYELNAVEFHEGENAFISFCKLTNKHSEFNTPVVKLYHKWGAFIEEMFGLKNNKQASWSFYVNGHFSQVGIESYILKNGDNILWAYEPNKLENQIKIGIVHHKIMD